MKDKPTFTFDNKMAAVGYGINHYPREEPVMKQQTLRQIHTDSKYLSFHQLLGRSQKTEVIRVQGTKDTLGIIKWHGAWRQYCFFPKADTLYNNQCMSEIQDMLSQLNKMQREKKANR